MFHRGSHGGAGRTAVGCRIALAGACLVLSGCRGPGGPAYEQSYMSPPAREVERPRPGPARYTPLAGRSEEVELGRSVQGRPISCQVFGQGPETILIMAGIHGSEPAGTPLVRELAGYLVRHPELLDGRRIILLPEANPDGLVAGRRFNVRGVDLNRNFPASNFAAVSRHGPRPLSEPESRLLDSLLEQHRPTRIVSLHQPLNCIDWDGPADRLAAAMAADCDLPLRKLGAQPGSLGSYAGNMLGIPIVTVELPGSASRLSPAELWARYGRMLLAAVVFDERENAAKPALRGLPPAGLLPAQAR